jgi:hypothetical protein
LLIVTLDFAIAATITELAAAEAFAVAAVVDAVVALLFVGLNHGVAAARTNLAQGTTLAVAAVVDAVVTLLADVFLYLLVAAACAQATRLGAVGLAVALFTPLGLSYAVATTRAATTFGGTRAIGVVVDAVVAGLAFVCVDDAVAAARCVTAQVGATTVLTIVVFAVVALLDDLNDAVTTARTPLTFSGAHAVATCVQTVVALFAEVGLGDCVTTGTNQTAGVSAIVARFFVFGVALFAPIGLYRAVAAPFTPDATWSALAVTAVVDVVVAFLLRRGDLAIAAEQFDLAEGATLVVAAIVAARAVIAAFEARFDDAVAAAGTVGAVGLTAVVTTGVDAVVALFALVYDAVATLDAAGDRAVGAGFFVCGVTLLAPS